MVKLIEILKNIDNISDEEVNKTIIRVKAVIVNSNEFVLLGHSHLEYQFPGGHVEEKEDLNVALRRELLEETGLEYDTSNLMPFAVNISYHKNYPEQGINTKVIIYYYEIHDDRIPVLSNTNYTEEEIDGNFRLRYIPLAIVEDVLKRNIITCGDASGIATEMLEVLKFYLN